jgi:hypothetical protein
MDINEIAHSIIEEVASLMFANFQADVLKELRDFKWDQFDNGNNMSVRFDPTEAVGENQGGIPSVRTVDLTQQNINTANKVIVGGIKVAAAAVAVHVAAGAIIGALPIVGITAGVLTFLGQGPLVLATLATVGSSISSIFSNHLTSKKMEALGPGRKEKGFLEGLVSTITERVYAKAQREKLINDYINSSLQPDFKHRLEQSGSGVIANIEEQLLKDSQEALDKIQNDLEELKRQKTEAAGVYQERMARLESYRSELQVPARLR